MRQDEFVALTTRLRRASDVLRKEGCLLQAISRRYFLVYAYAMQGAEKHGIGFRRGTDLDQNRRPTHNALPAIVEALYTGRNVGSVLGGGPRRHSDWAIDRS